MRRILIGTMVCVVLIGWTGCKKSGSSKSNSQPVGVQADNTATENVSEEGPSTSEATTESSIKEQVKAILAKLSALGLFGSASAYINPKTLYSTDALTIQADFKLDGTPASICLQESKEVGDCKWLSTVTPPLSYTFASDGYKTLYLWAKSADNEITAEPLTFSVTIDATTPTAPTITNPAESITSSTFKLEWLAAADTNLKGYEAKFCDTNTCDGTCLNTNDTTIFTAGKSATSMEVTFAIDTPYYSCLRAVDLAGNVTAWVVSSHTTMYYHSDLVYKLGGSGSSDTVGLLAAQSKVSSATSADGLEYPPATTVDERNGFTYLSFTSTGNWKGRISGTDLDIVVVQLSTFTGEVKWVRQLTSSVVNALTGFASDSTNRERIGGGGLAVDSAGDLYVALSSEGNLAATNPGTSENLILAKYDSSGNLKKIKQWPSVNGAGSAQIAIDTDDTIYIAGGDQTGGDPEDFIIRRLNSDWTSTWEAKNKYGKIGKPHTEAFMLPVKIGESGVYIGFSVGENANYVTGFCTPFAKQSNLTQAACTGAGGTWTAADTGGAGGASDMVFAKLDKSTGQFLWMNQLGAAFTASGKGNASAVDEVTGIALDKDENLYFSGNTKGSLAGTNGGGPQTLDIVYGKFNNSGTMQWIKQLGSSTSGTTADELSLVIAANSAGKVVIGGFAAVSSSNGGNLFGSTYGSFRDGLVFSIDPSNGAVIWAKRISDTVGLMVNDLYVTANGYTVWAGFMGGTLVSPSTGTEPYDAAGGVITPNGTITIPGM